MMATIWEKGFGNPPWRKSGGEWGDPGLLTIWGRVYKLAKGAKKASEGVKKRPMPARVLTIWGWTISNKGKREKKWFGREPYIFEVFTIWGIFTLSRQLASGRELCVRD